MRFIDSPFVSIQSEAHLDSFFAAAKPAKKTVLRVAPPGFE